MFDQGPVGIGYTCYCAPFFKNVEDKLEKDKVALMDHIDAAHDKLDAKITNLEHRTKSHIQHMSDNVKQKVSWMSMIQKYLNEWWIWLMYTSMINIIKCCCTISLSVILL